MSSKTTTVSHPAKFPKPILREIDLLLEKHFPPIGVPQRLCDLFLGQGGISGLHGDWELSGVEIEPEWAKQATEKGINTYIGDSRNLPFPGQHFGVICSSPGFGNRLADSYAPDMTNPKNKWRRSYRIDLGRPLSPGNGAALHWGDEYRDLHAQVWKEGGRVLCPGGLVILNIKDHYRKGVLQRVSEWHRDVIIDLGLELIDEVKVPLKGDQNTNTMRTRGVKVVDHELLYVFRKPWGAGRNPETDVMRG